MTPRGGVRRIILPQVRYENVVEAPYANGGSSMPGRVRGRGRGSLRWNHPRSNAAADPVPAATEAPRRSNLERGTSGVRRPQNATVTTGRLWGCSQNV